MEKQGGSEKFDKVCDIIKEKRLFIKLTIELNDNLFNELYLISSELNSNESEIIEKALESYFDSLDEIIVDKRLDDLQNKKERLIDADDVWKELGI